MKLADYVAKFIKDIGVKYVFAITGGAVTHLIDSISTTEGIEYVCNLHEQATAMAADAYSRVTGGIGVAMVTSGPGASNLLTGCCSSYYESVPIMFITGQVSVSRLKGDLKIRQFGFQETEVCEIFKPVVKYAITIKEASTIAYELEKAFYYAMNGRKGPVLIDIPDDIQREDIKPEQLTHFIPENDISLEPKLRMKECIEYLNISQKPLIVVGWGVTQSGSAKQMRALIELLNIPTVLTWAAMDMLPYDHPLNFGGFGMNGLDYGNYAIDNADLVISIGARLNTKHTGIPIAEFAPNAKKIVVDIDKEELSKFAYYGLKIDLLIQEDAKVFIDSLLIEAEKLQISFNIKEWIAKLNKRRDEKKTLYKKLDKVNPYKAIDVISKYLPKDSIIVGDTGCTIVWTMQEIQLKIGQKCFSSFNHTPMGYALPAAIGASFASKESMIVCITGDGGFQMNIQELGTLMHYNRNVKIIVFDNSGYSMIRNAQKRYLEGRCAATEVESGVACPNYIKIAKAYGYPSIYIENEDIIDQKIQELFNLEGPVFCTIAIPKEAGIEC